MCTIEMGEYTVVYEETNWRVFREQQLVGTMEFRRGEAVESLQQRAIDLYWAEKTEVTGVA